MKRREMNTSASGSPPDVAGLVRLICIVGAILRAWAAVAAPDAAKGRVDFAREIRPILAEHCWSCHGPDEAARKAKLRLDRREAAVAREAIVPRDPEQSALIERIESDDETFRMPPPRAKKDLTPNQKQRSLIVLLFHHQPPLQ